MGSRGSDRVTSSGHGAGVQTAPIGPLPVRQHTSVHGPTSGCRKVHTSLWDVLADIRSSDGCTMLQVADRL